MKKVLALYASPLTLMDKSYSKEGTDKYIKALNENNEYEVETIDINELPEFQSSLNASNFKSGEFFQNGDSDKWINKLFETDLLIISTSMINFNVPAVLKNFIDHVAVAGKTFKYKYDGNGESEGLLKNLTVQVIASQGAPKGWYPFGDHVAYLEGTFNFLGASLNKSILIDGTKTKDFDPSLVDQKIDEYFKN